MEEAERGLLDVCVFAMLLANVLWDATCVAWMLCAFDDAWATTPPHWALWDSEEDRRGTGARLLWCALVSQWALVRCWGACVLWLFPHHHTAAMAAMWIVFIVYELEALLMLLGALTGAMRWARAVPAAVLSFACAAVVMASTM